MARTVNESVNAKMAQSAIALMVTARAQKNGEEFIVMKVIVLILFCILYAHFFFVNPCTDCQYFRFPD